MPADFDCPACAGQDCNQKKFRKKTDTGKKQP